MKNILNPEWITGFTDAEGCFYIRVAKDKNYKTGWFVQACFQINLHSKDKNLLVSIKYYFKGVGCIYTTNNGKNSIYQVRDFNNITNVIIPHFDKYPLLSRKYHDFIMFKNIVNMVNKKEHLSIKGLYKIISFKNELNKGLPENLRIAFPSIDKVKRHVSNIPTIINPNWIGGFFSGEGCFQFTGRSLRVLIVQHYKDEFLMNVLINSLNCGILSEHHKHHILLTVSRFNDINTKIIPIFKKHNLIRGVKSLDFQDFCQIAELMEKNLHLTCLGLEKILKLKYNMNKNRKNIL